MKLNLPTFSIIGFLIVLITALIDNIIFNIDPIIENSAYAIGIILVIIGNLKSNKK